MFFSLRQPLGRQCFDRTVFFFLRQPLGRQYFDRTVLSRYPLLDSEEVTQTKDDEEEVTKTKRDERVSNSIGGQGNYSLV